MVIVTETVAVFEIVVLVIVAAIVKIMRQVG